VLKNFGDCAVCHDSAGWDLVYQVEHSSIKHAEALASGYRSARFRRGCGSRWRMRFRAWHVPILSNGLCRYVFSRFNAMNTNMDGKVALITGGSKGIGKAIAAAFVEAGATVVISSRKAEALENACDELNAIRANSASWVVANAGDAAQAQACVSEVMARNGRVDVLVNNAATNPYMGPILDIDASRAAKTVEVNQYGCILWSRLVRDAWMAEHGGSILNIASIGGLSVDGGIGYYNVTKAAVLHLTRNMAAELAPAIRVNSIAPGLVKTDMAKVLWEKHEASISARLPMKRLGEPEDIADAALFLCSDAASWITGVNLVVDGGALLGGVVS
jgi:NAD(P)-dependent dehydrogenase (short-subunit alcohol dehydrogenase family)